MSRGITSAEIFVKRFNSDAVNGFFDQSKRQIVVVE